MSEHLSLGAGFGLIQGQLMTQTCYLCFVHTTLLLNFKKQTMLAQPYQKKTAYKTYTPATESIDFQGTDFFDDLVEEINRLRGDKKGNRKGLYSRGAEGGLIKIVEKRTKLKLAKLSGGPPAVYTPHIHGNHVFLNQEFETWAESYFKDYSASSDSDELFKKYKTNKVEGWVDLKRGQVGGCFCDMNYRMLMPANMIEGNEYTAEEVAAIMLHEIGHLFTFVEFASRTATTNQALSLISRQLSKSTDYSKNKIVIAKFAQDIGFTGEEAERLGACKNDEEVSIVFTQAKIETCKRQLGASIYDVSSCEYLADQFATRHGAGVHLTTGLDKLHKSAWSSISTSDRIALTILTGVYLVGVGFYVYTFPIFMLTAIFGLFVVGPSKENDIYDNPFARMRRIKQQIIERLKDKDVENDEKDMLLEHISVIDRVMKDYDGQDGLRWWQTFAYIFRPGYRGAHNMEMLQKDLESMAGNDLFAAAAQLRR